MLQNCPSQQARRCNIMACRKDNICNGYFFFVKYSSVTCFDVALVFHSIVSGLLFASLSSNRCMSVSFNFVGLSFFYGHDPSLLFYLFCFWYFYVDTECYFSCLLESGQFSVLFEASYPVLRKEWAALESAGDVAVEEVWRKN